VLSDILGLTIKKKVLNEDSSKKVVPAHKLLKKAALNYADLSKAASDLNVVRQNIITLVGLYGVKSADKEDMHLLKEDEVEKKFAVEQGKGVASLAAVAAGAVAADNPKGAKFKKIKEGAKKLAENAKKLATQVKDQAKKLFKSLMDNIKKFAKQLLNKVKDYAKNAWKYLTELSDKIVGNKIKELQKKEGVKLAKQAAKKVGKAAVKVAARTAAVASGPVGWVVLIIWTLWDGLTDAWDTWQETGDWYETLKAGIAGLVDSLTFGLFDKETAAKVIDGTVNFLKDIPKNIGKFVSDTAKAIDDIVSGLVKKISDMNPLKPKPMSQADFAKIAEDAVKKAKEQDELRSKNEKLAENLSKAQQLVKEKTQQRDELINEVAALEVDAYGKKTEETEQVIKKKEELRKTEKALDNAIQKEGSMRQEAAAPRPVLPPSKPSPAPEGMKGRAKQFAEAITSLGIRNVYAIQALVATAAKESGLNPKSKELGAKPWIATIDKQGISYVYNKLPQLGPGGKVARLMNEPNGVPAEKLKEIWSKGDEAFFSMVYDGLSTNKRPGDGYLFRGRGFVQMTGRTVYKSVGDIIGVDLENNPDAIFNDFDIASKAAAGYIMNSVGQKNPKKGLDILNQLPDFNTALKVIVGNVGMGGLGGNMANVDAAFTTSKLAATMRGQLEKASKYESLALDSTSKEVSQGQREQMKPTDVNTVNVAQINNTKVSDTKVAAVDKKTNGNDALLSRAT
jgi:hypothetical protein